jgi:1-acyl-sn-glycerol-3-phosphate acyltransferase
MLPDQITRNLRGSVVFLALTVNTVLWFTPLILLAVLKLLLPARRQRIAISRGLMSIGENWVSGNALILGLRRPGRLEVNGVENLNRRGWYLVIANHQTWSDILILQTVFNRRIPFLKFFIKQELIWFPLLGIAWWALDMPFMKRYSKSYLARHPERKGQDLKATQAACEKFRTTPTSVINFVEGTRFSIEKKEKRGSLYHNLLPPRAGGIALALSSMGSMFDAILDVTVVYPEGVVTFWELCCGDQRAVVTDVIRRPVDEWLLRGDYASDREYRSAFHRWLTGIWTEKDKRIGELRGRATPVSRPGHATRGSRRLS